MDLLTKVFVLYKVDAYSRNPRKEISKSSRWYFYDNGIRNALIANVNTLAFRDDTGQLWENYLNYERIKFIEYKGIHCSDYFWRTHSKQEIDRIEELDGKLNAYEYKWSVNAKQKIPELFIKAYPDAKFTFVNSSNYLDFIA